jgi:predicted KAP-like P-loop ATPase
MWSDNETNRDFLNFATVAETAAEMIRQAGGKPLSMGISGGWGIGKSSMIKLIQEALSKDAKKQFLFVEFNAWLYQGYDDAKAALMEVIAQRLLEYGEETKHPVEKIQEFLSRVNWLRAAGFAARGVAAVKTLGASEAAIFAAVKAAGHGDIDGGGFDLVEKKGEAVIEASRKVLKAKKVDTPPKGIHDLRLHFAQLLKELGVTLVVFVDDLDRCLPDTAISTLEAMRLFLFMENTAFVIAADEKMIRHSVKAHFRDAAFDDELVTNYFDKLIQVPIRVPPLGTQEVRAYLFLLFIENSTLTQKAKDEARKKVCVQLGETWLGKQVDRDFVASLISDCPPELRSQFELADRIAPLMTSSAQIRGNPRLIKRFLNTLYLRLAAAKAQKVSVDEAALAKMLLFERCGKEEAHVSLLKQINENSEGKPGFLKTWEEAAMKGELVPNMPAEWSGDFERTWLALGPSLHDLDLRAVVYVSREHMPVITRADQLSPEATKLLEALLLLKQSAASELINKLKTIGKRDLGIVMDRLLVRAKQVQEWGVPPILYACLATVAAEESLSDVLVRFLGQIPPSQIRVPIVPLLKDKSWARTLIKEWAANPDTSSLVKSAIKAEQGK